MFETLRSIEVEGCSAPWTLRRATPRSRDHLLLEYRDPEGRVIGGQWFGDGSMLERIIDETERVSGIKPVLVPTGPGHGLILHTGGCDRRLRVLPDLLAQPSAVLLAHRPERRAVLRVERDGQVRFIKLLRPGRLQDALARHELASSIVGTSFRVPRIARVDADAGILEFESLAGTAPMTDGDPDALGRCWRAIGRALRALHTDTCTPPSTHDAQRECDILTDRLDLVRVFAPDVHAMIRPVMAEVLGRLCAPPSSPCLIHRDFYDKQILIDEGGRVGFLDFDTLAWGEPALDLANALVHIELRMVQGSLSRTAAEACARALMDGYAPGESVLARTPVYADATRARLVMLYAYRPSAPRVCGAILERIGKSPLGLDGKRTKRTPIREHTGAKPRPTIDRIPASPFVCIVGCPRSGTTMLERMVDAHPRIAVAHETHWITRYGRRKHGLSRRGLVTDTLLDALYRDRRFVRMGIERDTLEPLVRAGIDYPAFISHVFDHYRRLRGKELSADKSTGGHVRDLARLHTLCPETKIVHLIRDGRAVCLSMCSWKKAPRAAGRQDLWAISPVGTTALWWQWHIRCIRDQGRSLPDGIYHEMRYEELVRDPDGQCARLCDLLHIERCDRMARFHVGRENPDGHSPNASWQPPTPGLRDWRTQMPEHDIELFEALAGDTLDELGYERRFSHFPQTVRTQAEALRRTWNERHPRPVAASCRIPVRPAALQEKTP